MQRVPRRRLLAALLASLSLVAVAIPPIAGIASAASTTSTCPTGEGTECFLAISAPESVLTGVLFTVQVGVYVDSERTVLAKSDPCGSKVAVTLDVINDFDGPYSASQTVNASAGIATFSVTIPAGTANDGPYTLVANAGSFDLTAATTPDCGSYFYFGDTDGFTAITIPATQPIAPCPDNVTCVQTFSSGGTAATLIADSGTFTGVDFVDFIAAEGCGDTGPADTNGVLTFDYTPAVAGTPKTIVLALSSFLVTKGIGLYNICWRSNNPFTQLGGLAAPGPVGGPFTGYLPNCGKNATGPCVLFRKSNQYNVAFFGILAPPGDPKTYPR